MPTSTRAKDLLPFGAGPFALNLGVRALGIQDWIDVDPESMAAELSLKRSLIAQHPGVVTAMVDDPTAEEAGRELLEEVERWWATFGPSIGAAETSPSLDGLPAVVQAALRTQEDWCLLGPNLLAACVCFPTRWVLAEKLGRPLSEIHAPVAGYREHLARRVDRFVDQLRPERIVWRANWNLVDDPSLHQPYVPAPGRRLEATAADVADIVHLRVERQTLRRLPRTGAVAFGIHVHQRPLREFEARPDVLAGLRATVDALPPATFAYKGVAAFWPELQAWLASVLKTA